MPATGQARAAEIPGVLARHFQVHSDSAQATREVAAESRLHAELSPAGEDLLLRLVVTPLGIEGPRLPPASGRHRIMAAIGAEGWARNATSTPSAPVSMPCSMRCRSWKTRNSRRLRVAGERPGRCAGDGRNSARPARRGGGGMAQGQTRAGGRVEGAQVGLVVSAERDWFRVAGEALDDGLVLAFAALLASRQRAASSRWATASMPR